MTRDAFDNTSASVIEAAENLGKIAEAINTIGTYSHDGHYVTSLAEAVITSGEQIAAAINNLADAIREKSLKQPLIYQSNEADMLRATLEDVRELAGWHTDDETDENNNSPDDMTAHINGIIRKKCDAVLTPNAKIKA